ncbi:hypothetical protein [Candidatus Erwinia dacicola]|uniref:Uncharacterized protein n=1 Tax=Candidatus Erwinia dacicola TaxID=252393 RepID=A0A328TLX1_9GAMM|nr:hypothetical protein [Candidatus Erwinia dacicola]RAP71557.1 hypothetical protein ACZ87_01625 [Candidatus Erwinia dacicola]
MTREEAIAKLKALHTSYDPESDHADADKVICELLISLGYEDVVIEYDHVDKWYA